MCIDPYTLWAGKEFREVQDLRLIEPCWVDHHQLVVFCVRVKPVPPLCRGQGKHHQRQLCREFYPAPLTSIMRGHSSFPPHPPLPPGPSDTRGSRRSAGVGHPYDTSEAGAGETAAPRPGLAPAGGQLHSCPVCRVPGPPSRSRGFHAHHCLLRPAAGGGAVVTGDRRDRVCTALCCLPYISRSPPRICSEIQD